MMLPRADLARSIRTETDFARCRHWPPRWHACRLRAAISSTQAATKSFHFTFSLSTIIRLRATAVGRWALSHAAGDGDGRPRPRPSLPRRGTAGRRWRRHARRHSTGLVHCPLISCSDDRRELTSRQTRPTNRHVLGPPRLSSTLDKSCTGVSD